MNASPDIASVIAEATEKHEGVRARVLSRMRQPGSDSESNEALLLDLETADFSVWEANLQRAFDHMAIHTGAMFSATTFRLLYRHAIDNMNYEGEFEECDDFHWGHGTTDNPPSGEDAAPAAAGPEQEPR